MLLRRIVRVGSFVMLAAALAATALAPTSAGAADSRSASVASRAVAFLASQQRADGGFGEAEAGFPGFETPDVVIAIAEAAQPTLAYDAVRARAAVRAVAIAGRDGLGYLDDLADGGVDAGKAAQLVVVAAAVGLDASAFDPDLDGPTDLVAAMEAGRAQDGSYGPFFNSTAQAVIARRAIGRPIEAATVAYLQRAQQESGGYDFTGDPAAEGSDVDTTSRVIQALVAAGVPASDPSIAEALALLGRLQNADGSWSSFGAPDPNATAQAILAVEAAGFRAVDPCWREAVGVTGAPKASPDDFLRGSQAPDGRIASANDEFGINTFATSQSVQALLRSLTPTARGPRSACATTGYRIVAADGGVFALGDASFEGSAGDRPLNAPVVASAATPSGRGYWLFAADGGVFSFGDAAFFGSLGDVGLNEAIVAGAATPSGGGYWLVGADGGVFSFGDAPFEGSAASVRLNSPIVAADATASGRGYRLFAADGGVFSFGDATFEGSAGDRRLNRPIVGAAASRRGGGYWLFAADGGVFAFGDASFEGSAADLALHAPVVGGFRSRGDGYYLVAGDGGVFAFGAAFLGRPVDAPVVGAAVEP